jgi:hypothetical protein
MSLFLYLVRTRFGNLFSQSTGLWMSVGGGAAALFAILYGLLLGLLVALTPENSVSRTQVTVILVGGITSIIAFGVIKDFLPSYKRRPNLIPPIAPVGSVHRWLINQTTAVLNLFVGAFLLFTISFAIISWSSLDGPTWISLFLAVLFTAEFCSYVIRTLFEYHLRFHRLFLMLTLALVATMVYMFYLYYTTMSIWMPWAIMFAWGVLSLGVDLSVEELRTVRTTQRDILNTDQAIMRMVFRNDVVRRMLLLAFVFKIIMGVMLFFSIDRMFATRIIANQIIIWQYYLLLLSPVVIFTYVFGNAWVFFKEVYLNMQRVRPIRHSLFGTYVQLVTIPLLIDLTLVFFAIMIMELRWADAAGLVVMSHLLCVSIGFVGSILLPKKVDPSTTLRRSQIHTGVSLALFVVLVLFTTGYAFESTRWWTFGSSVIFSATLIYIGMRYSEIYLHRINNLVT